MNKSDIHIEIVRSSVPALSSMGQASCDMIVRTLKEQYRRVGVTIVNDENDLHKLVALRPDLVILGVKKVPSCNRLPTRRPVSIWVSSHLDKYGIAYTGSSAAAIALDYSKPAAKKIVAAAGIRTARHFMARPGKYFSAQQLPVPFPLFIKPPNTGGGKGIAADSVVRDFVSFRSKVASIAAEFQSHALVEAYLPGREFSVGILAGALPGELHAMPVELVTEQNHWGDRILGRGVKSADTERVIPVEDGPLSTELQAMAIDVFRALGARDYGRIDIRLDEQNVPYFLEANLIPGLAQHSFTSYFITACQLARGMDYQQVILRIVELGLQRRPYDTGARSVTPAPSKLPLLPVAA